MAGEPISKGRHDPRDKVMRFERGYDHKEGKYRPVMVWPGRADWITTNADARRESR